MINTCCVLTNWWIFIIMSWRLRAVINVVESVYETLHCGSATGETIIPIMANLFLLPPVDIMKLYFQEIELPIQGQMSFILLTCSAPSHSSLRAEVMHFYRDTQQDLKTSPCDIHGFKNARPTQSHAVWNTVPEVSLVQYLQFQTKAFVKRKMLHCNPEMSRPQTFFFFLNISVKNTMQ